ncbi:MAG: TVP38/TMEM64 family protein [Rhodobacteraceae bacterium]|nr:TVP38/TMEM64 family protein [Paracoccaceae bacterium]
MVIAALSAFGAFTLGDYLDFEALRDNRETLLAVRDANYGLLAIGFVLTYFLIVVFCLPGAVLSSVTGGFLFGLGMGTILNVFAAATGAMTLFLAVRRGLGAALSDRMDASDGTIKRLRTRLRENEISVLFLLRLVPVVPFTVANLLPALVGVRFCNFAVTTTLGIIPGAIVFTWLGMGLGEVFDRGERPDLTLLWAPHIIGPMLGLAALSAMPILIKALRKSKGR